MNVERNRLEMRKKVYNVSACHESVNGIEKVLLTAIEMNFKDQNSIPNPMYMADIGIALYGLGQQWL